MFVSEVTIPALFWQFHSVTRDPSFTRVSAFLLHLLSTGLLPGTPFLSSRLSCGETLAIRSTFQAQGRRKYGGRKMGPSQLNQHPLSTFLNVLSILPLTYYLLATT